MSAESLVLTAYHEAGHATVSWVVGLEMESVSIEPQEDSVGRVTLTAMKHMDVYDKILERLLVSSYAGLEAVELCTGQRTDPDNPNMDPREPGSDWDTIHEVISKLVSEPSARETLHERSKEEAQRILRENWLGVETVAEALLRHRSLDSEDLSRILEEANCPRGEPDYEYKVEQLADRLWELTDQYNALVEEGRQEEAGRVAEDLTRVESQMKDLDKLAERQYE